MTEKDPLSVLDEAQREALERYDFDRDTFLELRRRFLAGELSAEANRLGEGSVALPRADDITTMPAPDSSRTQELEAIGREAIEAGHVGMIILNGGMATRFGGVVKGTVDVCEGHSFLGLKLADAARWGAAVRVILMNSFATHDKTFDHLRQHDFFGLDTDQVDAFTQHVSVRMAPDGALFRDARGEPSLYAPGHGDLPYAIGRGALQRFVQAGGRYLWMSNVDNVLASIDPVLLGAHIEASRSRGVQMSVECAPRYEGDAGGMPARVDNHLQVVEFFRFPESFDESSIPVFNTNTFLFDASALAEDVSLTWFLVEKQVDDRPAIQFERLAGELSACLDAQFLAIERDGARSRFLPIKRPEDLDRARDGLCAIMRERGILS